MAVAQIAIAPRFSVAGKRAVLATMHGKERVIRPLLEGGLGLQIILPNGFDTDRFGTFSREIERTGSQLDAARAKIEAALNTTAPPGSQSPARAASGRTPLFPL